MSTQMKEQSNQLIFRKTNAQKGRTISVTPENSAMKHLVYGRIILDKDLPRVSFSTGKLESGLICLSGNCTITCDGVANEITQYDSIYLPRDSQIEVTIVIIIEKSTLRAHPRIINAIFFSLLLKNRNTIIIDSLVHK